MDLFRVKSIDSMMEQRQAAGLRKSLSTFDLVMLGVGAVVGSGIFILTGTGSLIAGPALSLSFVLAAVACFFSALSYAEFSSSLPVSGSVYTYVYATLGELPAWLIGWILILEFGLAASAVAAGWSGYLQSLVVSLGIQLPEALRAAPGAMPDRATLFNLPAFLVIAAVTALLSVGIRESKRVNNIMVVIKILVVVLFIAAGAMHVRTENWTPFMPYGMSGVYAGAALMFYAFIGFDAVASSAEEVRNPQRSLPLGILGSLLICTVLYVLVTLVMTGIVPYGDFAANSDHPVSLALQRTGQMGLAGVIDLGAILGMTTVILVMSYGLTRILYAMARDGLLPRKLAALHPRYATPFSLTWSVGLIFALIAGLVPLAVLAELINIGTLTAFSLISLAVIVLRRTHPDLPRGFRCPGVPYVPLAAVACCVFLIAHLGSFTWLAFCLWILAGLAVYFLYSRRKAVLGASVAATESGR
ncbi:amino acid permease [Pigmentiphaga sp. NML080357]|uniref:amino acid permease n=1 Tax=Pigmentiphaga sp. NML080357 TaxID=2008675 RepID=UPI000B41977A|nr:amino acid permease [Pigmentiphaga sp. NML080357]OVZ57494.1 amino acid permease [Pigmentiphaga sp. NML080357]